MATARVIYHLEDHTWWAESPDVPGWTAAADDLAELRRLVNDGVRFALERDDVDVAHGFSHELGPAIAGARTTGATSRLEFREPAGVHLASEPPPAGVLSEPAVVV